jgi:hypothetical protein
MKPTAVEFAVEQLEQLIPFGHQLAIRIILEQAKEMEKQQIIDACDNAHKIDFYVKYYDAEQYYNETFNK